MTNVARLSRKSIGGSSRAVRAFRSNARNPNGLNQAGDQPGRRPAVLLAYSGTGKREYLAVFLASRGCDVTTCNNGREALAYVAAGCFDLVVTGIVMPSLDGLELVRTLRRRQAGLPVIAIADSKDKMDQIYLRNAALSGAVATHTLCETGSQLLKTVDWILRGRDDVRSNGVW